QRESQQHCLGLHGSGLRRRFGLGRKRLFDQRHWKRCERLPPSLSLPRNRQGNEMTQFDDREKAFENMYARDQELQFKIVARRNRLLGLWAAKKMGLTEVEADAYARDVIRADFEEGGDDDVIRKLIGDLTSAGIEIDDATLRQAVEHKTVEAPRQFIEAEGKARGP